MGKRFNITLFVHADNREVLTQPFGLNAELVKGIDADFFRCQLYAVSGCYVSGGSYGFQTPSAETIDDLRSSAYSQHW